MSSLDQYINPSLRGRVQEEATQGEKISCERIQPKDSKWIGRGQGRCVFEKDNKVIKVAHSPEGLAQNKSAKKVKKYVFEGENAFAMPEIAKEEVIVQEKTEPFDKFRKKHPDKKTAEVHGIVIDKLDKVSEEEGIFCSDTNDLTNIGYIEGKGGVLRDLGLCGTVTPTKTVAKRNRQKHLQGGQ